MIPGSVLKFLEDEAMVAVAASRNENRVPHLHRVSGWSVDADCQTISCFIPDAYTAGLSSSLEDNGEFALTVVAPGSHKTYQFKGQYVDSRPITDADLAIAEQKRGQFAEAVSQSFGMPEDACRTYILPPNLVIQFSVREIFVQTPGPDAGQRVVPPEE